MPAFFTPAQRAALLEQLLVRRAAGETFKAIAATPGWPSRPTLRKWLRRRPDLDVPPLRARPVHWSEAIADEICLRAEDHSLREICEDPAMPDRKTLYTWTFTHRDFARRLLAVRVRSGQPWIGRRSTYHPLYADDVVEAVFETGSIHAACQDPDQPPARTVRDWARAHPEFARQLDIAYEMARERRIGPLLEAAEARLNARIARITAAQAAKPRARRKP